MIKSITNPSLAAVAAAVALLMAAPQPAQAQDDSYANAKGKFQIRARGIWVAPVESANSISIGGDVDISNQVVPELDFTYFVTDNIAFELIAAITPHDVRAVGTAAGDVDLGDVTLLPPTLTLQYHVPFDNGFKPYVGVGINYTAFFDEDVPSAGVVTDTHFDDSVGPALQVGMDYFLTDDWFVNLDFKYLFIDTDVSINGGDITASVDINPIVFGFGVGYRF